MSSIDVVGASSKGYQKIMRDCKKSAEEMALECRDVNLDAQRAIVCAKEIAERELKVFEVRFADELHIGGKYFKAVYYHRGKHALFHTGHLRHLVKIILGEAQPRPMARILSRRILAQT